MFQLIAHIRNLINRLSGYQENFSVVKPLGTTRTLKNYFKYPHSPLNTLGKTGQVLFQNACIIIQKSTDWEWHALVLR